MDGTTELIARPASAHLVVTGLGLLLSTDFSARMVRASARTDPVTLNLSGKVHFLIGVSILLVHFRWAGLPEVIVTPLGVAAALEGASMIVDPALTLPRPTTGRAALSVAGIVLIAVATHLGCMSYL